MLDPARLDALAAGLAVLARFHQEPPDDAVLTTFWDLLDEWPLPGTPETDEGLRLLRQARAANEDATTIRADHAGLYGTFAVARVAPYESVHRGTDRLVFDVQTLEVRQAYRALSLQAPRLNQEPDDHIGLELDFLAQSCLRALDAWERGAVSEAERLIRLGTDFYADHLARWAPEMLDRVAGEARSRFMAGLAHLSLGALESYAQAAAPSAPREPSAPQS